MKHMKINSQFLLINQSINKAFLEQLIRGPAQVDEPSEKYLID